MVGLLVGLINTAWKYREVNLQPSSGFEKGDQVISKKTHTHTTAIYIYICIHLIGIYFPLFYLFILCCISLSHTYITHSFTFFSACFFSHSEHQGRHVQELQGLLPACHIGTAGRQGGERKQGPLEAMVTHLLANELV